MLGNFLGEMGRSLRGEGYFTDLIPMFRVDRTERVGFYSLYENTTSFFSYFLSLSAFIYTFPWILSAELLITNCAIFQPGIYLRLS